MNYEDNLRHLAEPAAPNGRKKAVSATLASFEALWLTEQLREYAHYGDHPNDEHEGIALAYAEFIDRKVRDQEKQYVTIYAHTEAAADALMGALFHAEPDDRTDEALTQAVSSPLAELYVEHVEGDPEEPEPVEDVAGGTVEFDEGSAMEAEAERALAEAESEHLADNQKSAI